MAIEVFTKAIFEEEIMNIFVVRVVDDSHSETVEENFDENEDEDDFDVFRKQHPSQDFR